MKNISNSGKKGLHNISKPGYGSIVIAMLVLCSHFTACHCNKNHPNDSNSSEHSSGETNNNTSNGSTSTEESSILSNSKDITADMLNTLSEILVSIDSRIKRYLDPKSKIDIDKRDISGKTILSDVVSCMSNRQLPLGVKNEASVRRQQAMIDTSNALLNRGARPDIPNNKGYIPLSDMVDHCVDIHNCNKNRAVRINRDKEIALLKKMLQTPNLINTDAKLLHHNKSAYEVAQAASDKEVLDLLTLFGITK